MGNLTGTPFLPAVTKQIEKRQEFLGVNPKKDEQIIWQNNKSAFLRLASSVNIEDEYKVAGAKFNTYQEANQFLKEGLANKKLDPKTEVEPIKAADILKERNLPSVLAGDLLAKNAILFGGVNGVLALSNTPYFNEGIFTKISNSYDISDTFGSAYGWGGLQQGYVPMPGINSADISYYNRGALQKVTINCKVFSVEQLQVFDLLYFKIGYSMLIEWGHNIYIDNNGVLQNRTDYFTDPFNLFFGTGTVQTDSKLSKQNQILQSIKLEREKSAYNYDAMLGKLTNFSWKFNTDGSYDITLNLIGLGDVIESLRVNQSITIKNSPEAPSVKIADEGRQIAAQQKASESAIAGERKTLEGEQKALGKAQEEAGKLNSENGKKWDQNYALIPEFNQLQFFSSPPTSPVERDNLLKKWTLFKNRSYVTDDRSRIKQEALNDVGTYGNAVKVTLQVTQENSDGTTRNITQTQTIGDEVPFDSNDYTESVTRFTVIKDANGNFKNITFSEYPAGVGGDDPRWLYFRNQILAVYNNAYPRKKYEGGRYNLVSQGRTLTEDGGTSELYKLEVWGLYPFYARIYESVLIPLANQTQNEKKTEKANAGAGAALDAKQTQLDAKEKLLEQKFRDLTRAVEAKKERQELAPEAAKESASKTKLNAILWGWIDLLNSTNTDQTQNELINKNFKKIEYRAKSMNSGETGVSEHQFTQYYVRFGYFLDWISQNLLYYDITDIIKTKGTGNPTIGSTDHAKLPANVKNSIYKQQNAANNPNPQTTVTQPNTQQRLTSTYLQNIVTPPDNAVPLFTIDTDEDTNFCLAWRFQISSDPFVCLIPMNGTDANGNGWKFFTKENQIDLSSYFVLGTSPSKPLTPFEETLVKTVEDNKIKGGILPSSYAKYLAIKESKFPSPFKGKVMNIYMNIDFLAKILASNVDVNGKVNLLTYLNSICNSVNDTLGNVNKLQAIYDAEENQVRIIDDNILKRETNDDDAVAVFESFGVTLPSEINATNGGPIISPGKGSFLRNIDFQVQLPPNMAAMATISAQAKGNIVGENATALSKLNDGLKDRIITYKLDAETLGKESKAQKDKKSKPTTEELFQENLNKMYQILKELYVDFMYQKDNVDTLRALNRDVSLHILGEYAERGNTPAPFFIPFNLSLDMDGLSGMVNYQRFGIQESILPYSYRPAIKSLGLRSDPKIDFLIKGITHKISNNEWTTKIDSLSVSAQPKRTISYNLQQEQKLLDLSFLGNTAQQPKSSLNK